MIKLNQIPVSKIIDPEFLISAYAAGYFPMADSREGEIGWYSPDPRAIIPLDKLKISRSLHQALNKNIFDLRIDTSFEQVMRCCSERKDTWISETIIQSYLKLFMFGYAHSVEAWKDEKLLGGLYGVSIGAAFFGESMFSRVKDASKVALVFLVNRLRENKFQLLDTQFITPHLKNLGAIEIPRSDYLILLKKAISKQRTFVK
ncbi:MAG: leucyl/phenylalanyl-tRNA--protein transferase [Chlorobiaceae bacterium]|nr:leucyl/phenylalanyl-tRNA--protein transferase [Chlorobiaceae bacterium]